MKFMMEFWQAELHSEHWMYHIMSYVITPFEVSSQALAAPVEVRFVHLYSAIATRHSDTMDCKFLVDGKGVILGLAHPGFVDFRDRTGRNLSDREASYIAAEYLRERLEQEDEHSLYDVSTADVIRIIEKIGIR